MTRFHFDLRHLTQTSGLRVRAQGREFQLQAHSPSSLAAARQSNPCLAAMPAELDLSVTHFADIDQQALPDDAISWVRVVRPAPPGVHLDEIVRIALILPKPYLGAYLRQRTAPAQGPKQGLAPCRPGDSRTRAVLHSGKLAALGIASLPEDIDTAIEVLVAAQTVVTAIDTAGAFVVHHPDLASVQPFTATLVYNGHILPDPAIAPDQYNAMQLLAQAITGLGDQPWSPVVPCKDKSGRAMTAGYALDGILPGQQLYTYAVAPTVMQAALPPAAGARRTASNDVQLRSKAWSPTPGTSSLSRHGSTLPGRPTGKEDVAYKWTITEQTNHHGVDVAGLTVDEQDNFAVNASNSYLRTLYAGYQLLDENSAPIGSKAMLESISATNSLLGIPMPTDPTALQVPLQGAASLTLYFGSLGTTDWDADVSPKGALLTGLWQYGIPIVFLVVGKALASTAVFNAIVNDRKLVALVLSLMISYVETGSADVAALDNSQSMLISLADVTLGLVLQAGMESLGKWLAEQVAEGAISEAFGPVGWVLRLVAAGMDFEEMAVTTGEVLSSPACISVSFSRAIDVSLRLHPDPRHGEAGDPGSAVWPSVATTYLATLQYKGGTSVNLSGALPDTTSKTPIALLFPDVAAGGQFRIVAGVYSRNGWLAGTYQTDWIAAQPNQGILLDLGDQTITEILVPLSPDTQYVFKERVALQGGRFVWQSGGGPPSATIADLDCGAAGTLCSLAGITINNSAFQVGYAWRASGQGLSPDTPSEPASGEQLYALQNLSVLADPGSRLISSGIGLTQLPAIAYAPSTNTPATIDQTNFVIDPRQGGMQLRQVLLNTGHADFGLATPGLQSWGRFPLQNIDAAVVHPSGAVIACSWQDHKLMLLQVPAAPVPDGKAPVALMVSGEGLRAGLTRGPKALAVTPDGRILVLETTNQRIQAFDDKGNAVACFTPADPLFTLPTAAVAADLDAGQIPEAFQAGLVTSAALFLATLDIAFAAQLDTAVFQASNDPLITALSTQGVLLSYDPANLTDPALSAQITVVQCGQSWIISDPRGMQWQITNAQTMLYIFARPAQARVRIDVQAPGQQWLLTDRDSGDTWQIAPSADPAQSNVSACQSYFALHGSAAGAPTWLDLAVEARGYIYVLLHTGDGTHPTDYLLDIYDPSGRFSVRTPNPAVTNTPQNVVAGCIAVDLWRNVYALGYDTLLGPTGGPQPTLAHWNPTPPLFTMPLSDQLALNQPNISVISQAFTAGGVTLSSAAFITTADQNGAWSVSDGPVIYHVYRVGAGLQVYVTPA